MTDGPQGMHDVPTHHGAGGVPHPPPPASRRARSDLVWVVPVVGIACLIAAFSLVTMLLGRGGPEQSAPTLDQITRSESPSTASSSTSDTVAPSSTNTSTTQASSATSSQVSSESASAGASSVSFPAGTGQHCQTYDGATITVEDPDVQQTNGGKTSCDFLVDLRRSVWAHDGTSPGDSTYTLDVFSKVTLRYDEASGGMVHLQCTPANGLVHCVSEKSAVDAWVRSQHP